MLLDPNPLGGRFATILGGSGGIGAATARLFAEAGAAVAVVAHSDPAKAQAIVAGVVLACATTLAYSTGSVIQVDGGRHL